MDLVSLYNEYVKISEQYINYIYELSGDDLGDCNNENIQDKLKSYQIKFEDMMIKANVLEVDDENKNNLQDLKYLVMDTLLAATDITAFYNYKEVERFKMRAVNFVNKRRRAEMFNESRDSQCRVGFFE
ncbi:MAG: hypothetical protein ACRC57_12995 [Sarcina sp.]